MRTPAHGWKLHVWIACPFFDKLREVCNNANVDCSRFGLIQGVKGGDVMKVLSGLALVILATIMTLHTVEAKTLFEDYFNQGTDRWSFAENSGKFQVKNDNSVPAGYGPEVLNMQTPSDWSAAYVKDLEVTDCIVIALVKDISLPKTGDDADQVIIARTQDEAGIGNANGDALEQDAPDDTGLHLFGGGGQNVEVNDHHSTGEWTWMMLRLEGEDVRAKVWGFDEPEPDWLVELEEPVYKSGGVGMGIWSGELHVAYYAVADLGGLAVDTQNKLTATWGEIK
jgi:hypothetical protein